IKEALHEPQMWNRYAYVTNNPLKYIDPNGRERLPCASYPNCQPIPWQGWQQELKTVGGTALLFGGVLVGPGLVADAFGGLASWLGIDTAATAATTSGPVAETVRRVMMDQNKLSHIFGNAEHMLEDVVERFGSEENAVKGV